MAPSSDCPFGKITKNMNVSEVVPKILAAQDISTNKRKRWILEIEENNPEALKVAAAVAVLLHIF